jgi:hypothetical protein
MLPSANGINARDFQNPGSPRQNFRRPADGDEQIANPPIGESYDLSGHTGL